MIKCTFCGKVLPAAKGKMYVKSDGKIFYFCSSKCEKNQISMKRKGRTSKWTTIAAEEKAKIKASTKK